MQRIDPILADLKIITGNFPQATGHYTKTFNELEGMYENEQEFQKMLPKWKNRVVYKVWEISEITGKSKLVKRMPKCSSVINWFDHRMI